MWRMRTILPWLALSAAASTSCGADERFYIVQNQVPGSGCLISTTRTVYNGEGTMDVALVDESTPYGYVLFPLVANEYPATGGSGAPEGNRLFVRAFRVQVEAGDGAPARIFELFDRLANNEQTRPMVAYQEAWAATLDPGGVLSASVGVIPGALARQIRDAGVLENAATIPLLVKVRAVGERPDGEVESKEFVYPIKVCLSCLISDLRPCPYTPRNRGNFCNISQDDPVDCCSAGTELVCPASTPAVIPPAN
jgi:hypothetical protein